MTTAAERRRTNAPDPEAEAVRGDRAGSSDRGYEEAVPAEAPAVRYLTRADILAADDIQYRVVEVPEWGGPVRLKSMTGTERDAYDAESYRQQAAATTPEAGTVPGSIANFRVRRVARSIVDERGRRVFSDADMAALGAKNGAVIDRLDDVVAELSGLDAGATARATAALKAAPSAEAGSDSA